MIGMFFAHIAPDPRTPGRMLIKQGTVKAAVGVGRWLLSFQGKGYNFSNVFSAEALDGFAFFDTVAERQAFIADLLAANAPPDVVVPPSANGQSITEVSPEPVVDP